MSLAIVYSRAQLGIHAPLITVETHRARRFNRAAESGRLDRFGVKLLSLRGGQDDIAVHRGAQRSGLPGARG